MSYDSTTHHVFTDIVLVPSSVTTCASIVHIKMTAFTGSEHAYCVILFPETQSATIVQCRFRTQYGKDPPSRPTIYSWHQTFC
ncbi:hypothetical protein C0J52_16913 [Blattella germanica]|nr:hypothetical protein C0J52_16913 [Blattella germanica]